MSPPSNRPQPERAAFRSRLQADCESCFGLCCAALPFAASSDFAIDKAAGQPCPNLQKDFRCGIHSSLRERGFRGCTVYDCFGAGQTVSQVTFGGTDWRQAPETAKTMFEVFPVMRQLYELLWYEEEALEVPAVRALYPELQAARDETERLTRLEPAALRELDAATHRAEVNLLLLRVSELVRAEAEAGRRRQGGARSGAKRAFGRGADLFGAKLKGADLRGAFLRGACLIAADLREANLNGADLIGADMRDTDLRGADLTGSLFLTVFQVNAAKGDSRTKLPPGLPRPSHWAG
ncbi:pentapeptide repeat-containing protein [Paenibacillus aurantius]|uniref:Pentapeptide repeat-containing protein n=1 Tax=Paenibacillus aurantius TaxID=2918900 RepID=A0AA96LG13_9BACL|nr:pentapeptide repeat-containing protein [Paenibacillus aurantius]WNQ10847.1 pentapeptide repeat-containing protein [Paenibacillus aurantius]